MAALEDPEIKAMNNILESLTPLDLESQKRVIQWISGKLGLSGTVIPFQEPASGTYGQDNKKRGVGRYDSLAEAFSGANPNTDVEKVLIVAAYLQEKFQKEDLTGYEINKELNHLGHSVSNITSTISVLMSRKPQLIIQTKKEGKTQQAKKKYKVTLEGLNFANKMTVKN